MSEDVPENESPAQFETKHLIETIEHLLRQSDDRPQEGFLTGFVAAVEWMKPDGTYAFWRYNGDASGQGLPPWRINGLCDYAKTGGWSDIGPDDEDDE